MCFGFLVNGTEQMLTVLVESHKRGGGSFFSSEKKNYFLFLIIIEVNVHTKTHTLSFCREI